MTLTSQRTEMNNRLEMCGEEEDDEDVGVCLNIYDDGDMLDVGKGKPSRVGVRPSLESGDEEVKRGLLGWQNSFLDTIASKFDGTHTNFVLGNAQSSELPIVYCSDGFCQLTGYSKSELLEKHCSCSFLFGKETSRDSVEELKEALGKKLETTIDMELCRQNGSSFSCLVSVVPIKNERGEVVLFLISHKNQQQQQLQQQQLNNHVTFREEENKETSQENVLSAMTTDDDQKTESSGDGGSRGTSANNSDVDSMDDLHECEALKYQRHRSRPVLFQLQTGALKGDRNRKLRLHKQIKNLSGAEDPPEYKAQKVKRSKLILLHYGIFKIGWDWLILLCTFYIAITVPYNAAFVSSLEAINERTSIVTDVIVEMLFIIDIMLNFRTTYVNKSGQVVYEPRLIAINYMRGWFLLDLLAAIPFDLLYAFQVQTSALHLLKVARLLRLARLMQKLDRYSQYSFVVLTLLMAMFCVLAHWLACIWYCIGKQELEMNEPNWTVGWLYQLSEKLNSPIMNRTVNLPTLTSCYISALYFTCTSLTSVGFGNVSPNTNSEKIFSVIAMLIGALMHALVFGNVTAIIQRMYARRAIYQSKTQDLKDFFRTHHFPRPLKQRMQEYFQTTWSLNSGIDPQEVMGDFPIEMQGDIAMHLHREVLSLPIFSGLSQGCLKSIAMQCKPMFCAPGEFITRKGDAIGFIYFVSNGSLEVLKEGMVVAILGKGDLFGSDLCMDEKIPISKSSCDVKSLTYCDLQCINLEGFKSVLRLYPEYAEQCANDLLNDLTYNLREGFVDPDDKDAIFAPAITLPTISEETGSAASEVQAMTVGASETNSVSSTLCATSNSVQQSANGDGPAQETPASGKNSKQSSTEKEDGADDNGSEAAKQPHEKKEVQRRFTRQQTAPLPSCHTSKIRRRERSSLRFDETFEGGRHGDGARVKDIFQETKNANQLLKSLDERVTAIEKEIFQVGSDVKNIVSLLGKFLLQNNQVRTHDEIEPWRREQHEAGCNSTFLSSSGGQKLERCRSIDQTIPHKHRIHRQTSLAINSEMMQRSPAYIPLSSSPGNQPLTDFIIDLSTSEPLVNTDVSTRQSQRPDSVKLDFSVNRSPSSVAKLKQVMSVDESWKSQRNFPLQSFKSLDEGAAIRSFYARGPADEENPGFSGHFHHISFRGGSTTDSGIASRSFCSFSETTNPPKLVPTEGDNVGNSSQSISTSISSRVTEANPFQPSLTPGSCRTSFSDLATYLLMTKVRCKVPEESSTLATSSGPEPLPCSASPQQHEIIKQSLTSAPRIQRRDYPLPLITITPGVGDQNSFVYRSSSDFQITEETSEDTDPLIKRTDNLPHTLP